MTFTRKQSPFENDNVLAEEYIPDTVVGRDEELNGISEVLQQIIDNEQPVNSFIYGISGTGKTVSMKFKQQQLEESVKQYDDVNVTFVYQVCESLSSSYQVAITIANQFLEDDDYAYLRDRIDARYDVLPSSGLPKEQVYTIFFQILDALTYENTEYRDRLREAIADTPTLDLDVETLLADTPTSTVDHDSATDIDREALLKQLHDEYDIPPPEEVTNYVTVILDEVDRIGSHDELLYEIPRANANDRVSNIRLSVIGISNDIAYKESIKSKTDSSLRLKEITFTKYDADQLREILQQRAELAFTDGAYEDDIIPLAAAFARQQGGDARYALDLLHKAGLKAKNCGESTVTEEHVRIANEEKERDRVYEVTNDLDEQEKLVLAAIMYHDLRGETPISRGDLYPTYKRFSGEILEKTNVPRRIADYLKEMSQLGLLERHDAYAGPGESGYKYGLDTVDYDMILQTLEETGAPITHMGSLLPAELKEVYEDATTGDGSDGEKDDANGQTNVNTWEGK